MLILLVLLTLASPALAGTATCTYDDAAVAPLAAQLKVEPSKLCQALLDQRIKSAAQAEQFRKLNAVRKACAGGDKPSCAALDAAAAKAPAK